MSTVIHIHCGTPLIELQLGLQDTYSALNDTVAELNNIYRELDLVPKQNANLRDAGSSLVLCRNQDQDLVRVVETNEQKLSDFLDHTRQTDLRVCGYIGRSQEKLFQAYPHLRLVETEEKSWWEELIDDLSELCGKAKDALFTAGKVVWEWAKDHVVELIVGTIAVVVGAVLIAVTGGTATPFVAAFGKALLVGFGTAGLSGLIDGAVSAATAWFTGSDPLKAFGDGVASGFMWGGIGYALAGGLKLFKTGGKLDWNRVMNKGKGETAYDHIGKHMQPNPGKSKHGVFNLTDGKTYQDIVNEAASKRGLYNPIPDGRGGVIYNIPYKNAGIGTGKKDAGMICNFITIITEGRGKLVTAFPAIEPLVRVSKYEFVYNPFKLGVLISGGGILFDGVKNLFAGLSGNK